MLNSDLPTAPADVLILPMTEDLTEAASAATYLRAQGIRTQLYTEPRKMKGKLGYADKLRIPYVAFLGEDEIAAGKITIRNMVDGGQETVSVSDAAELIQSGLKAHAGGKLILG